MKIKIVIGYHKPANLFQTEDKIFYNLQLGKAISTKENKDGESISSYASWFDKNTHGDNSGENISELNREFSELTGIYWIWKNYDQIGNPEYIGFMQYRRILCLRNYNNLINKFKKIEKRDFFNEIDIPFKCEHFEELLGYSDIERYLDPSKILVCYKKNTEKLIDYNKKLTCFNQNSFDKSLEIIFKQTDIDKKKFSKYLEDNEFFWGNTFIVNKTIFFELCEWLFPILFKINKYLDYSFLSIQEHRIIGYVAEILIGYFWLLKRDEQNLKIIAKKNIFIENCNLFPSYYKREIRKCADIAYVFNRDFLKYLIPSLKSLISHTSIEHLYNIYLLSTFNFDTELKNYFNQLVKNCPNIKISYIDISYISCRVENGDFKRILMRTVLEFYKIFPNVSKLIYLDCDTIICSNIYELAQTNLSNFLIGACRDTDKRLAARNNIFNPFSSYDFDFNREAIFDFINPGVVIFDLKKISNDNDFIKTKKYLITNIDALDNNYNDLFNFLFAKKIYFLSPSWNAQVSLLERINSLAWDIDQNFYEKYKKDILNYKVIHFNADFKPLNNMTPYSNIWWKYNTNTLFYIQSLSELFDNNFTPRVENYLQSIKVIKIFKYLLVFYYYKFKFLSKIIKKHKKHYNEKIAKVKKLIFLFRER